MDRGKAGTGSTTREQFEGYPSVCIAESVIDLAGMEGKLRKVSE